MLLVDNKEIVSIIKNNKVVLEIYKNAQLVWQAIRSCFGKGFWANDKPWINDDGFKNN